MFNRNRHLSLTDARHRMRKLLSKPDAPVLPADVTTTCVPVGTVPVRVIPPIHKSTPISSIQPTSYQEPQSESPAESPDLTSSPALLDNREKIITDLCSLILRAEFLPDPDLAIALFSCLRLVTEGKSTLARAQEQEQDQDQNVDYDSEWRM